MAKLLLVTFFSLQFIAMALSLDCYTDVDMSQKEDCQMHTGCLKRFDVKTKETIERSCFLTDGVKDKCGVEKNGVGYCYCHSNLCNGGWRLTAVTSIPIMALASTLFKLFLV